jgi:methanogenic corrinoid protein MtbC1
MLRAWMIAIHSSIKPPESRDLTRPLEYLCRLLHSVYSAEYVDGEPLSPDAQHFLSLLLDKKRRDAADYALGKAAGGSNLAQVYAGLVLPALNQVGVLWQKNKISVADEHAATEIGRYVISRLIDSVPRERPIGVKALVACVPGEEHDVGAQVASGILEAKGWAVIYVGRSAPEEEIIKVLESERPRVAVFDIALIARLPGARDLFVKVRSGPGSTKIIAGGRAALAARKVLEAYVDAVVDGPDELHEVALRLVGKDA